MCVYVCVLLCSIIAVLVNVTGYDSKKIQLLIVELNSNSSVFYLFICLLSCEKVLKLCLALDQAYTEIV